LATENPGFGRGFSVGWASSFGGVDGVAGDGLGVRQEALTTHLDMPPEWVERVNPHPLFVMLDAIDNHLGQKKSPGRSKKNPMRRQRYRRPSVFTAFGESF
jgi:hypothetical protein